VAITRETSVTGVPQAARRPHDEPALFVGYLPQTAEYREVPLLSFLSTTRTLRLIHSLGIRSLSMTPSQSPSDTLILHGLLNDTHVIIKL
jgi:hypothetical protein